MDDFGSRASKGTSDWDGSECPVGYRMVSKEINAMLMLSTYKSSMIQEDVTAHA